MTAPAILFLVAMIFADPGLTGISVGPTEVRLLGSDSETQLVVTGQYNNGSSVDLTSQANYEFLDPEIASIDSRGVIHAEHDGATALKVRHSGHSETVIVRVFDATDARPVHFATDVMPILTKSGCNAGGCHGKASGQNGFKLSLLGFDANADFQSLVQEGRGRRMFPAQPDASLFLLKATGTTPHAGGKKLKKDTPDYNTIRRWISQGMPRGSDREPKLLSIRVEPAERRLFPRNTQQIRVEARYDDGSIRDVTRLAQFKSNAPDIADVSEDARVGTLDSVGEAAIMARFGGQVAVSRVTVPRPEPVTFDEPPARNFIDPLVFGKLRELGIAPSPPCTDVEFARRSSLDICGLLPSPEEVTAFRSDLDPEKRTKWVERLLDRGEYADLFAMKWSAILKNSAQFGQLSRPGSFGFHAWIRQAIASNMPYDKFAAAIVSARGEAAINPPVVWYRSVNTTEEQVDDTAQLFLGLRLQCARCHHHPFEAWSQDDYFGFASVFARIGRKGSFDAVTARVFTMPTGLATNPTTGKKMPPKPPGGEPFGELGPRQDPREVLADWFRQPENPFLAKAVVNRYWKHFLGRGLVEPEDDMRATNPPTNPALLDALAADFVQNGYDLKRLARLIATSQAYDRSSLPNASNVTDRQNFARFYPRRLPAEVLLDALNVATGNQEDFRDLPKGFRTTQLPDNSIASYFLDVFGRPKRESVCECERSSEANLSQTLHLLNSGEIQTKLSANIGRIKALDEDKRSDVEKVDELYRICISRSPTDDELEVCTTHLTRRRSEKNSRQGFEDLVWALINTKEFLFVN